MDHTSREVYEYISKQSRDPIVERKVCAVSGVQFPIFQSDLDFYDKISPSFAGVKFQIPTPTLCPEERQRRRLLFRNERKLYRRTCDFSGKEIISIYSPDKPYKVYDQSVWRSDSWDALNYGREFDSSKTFSDQFNQLMLDIPHLGLVVSADATENNCSYVNFAGHNKNCYLVFDSDFNEDCYYSNVLKNCNKCIDSSFSSQCSGSSGLLHCVLCYECVNCHYSSDCKFCSLCVGCTNCEYCYNCSNLVGKKFCIGNIQYSEHEYKTLLGNSPIEQISILPALRITGENTETIYGSALVYSNNSVFSYDGGGLQDIKYSTGLFDAKDCFDIDSFGDDLLLSYESLSCGHHVYGAYFSILVFANSDQLYYCQECPTCTYCFGCIGLRNKQYCIFNKQYTKEEYEQLVGKIIGHMQTTGEWGDFFHPSLSPFGYNETVAAEYFPLLKEEASIKSYKWQSNNYDPKIPENVKVIKPLDYTQEQRSQLKNDDKIVKQIILCTESSRPFRILKQELEFYRKHDLQLPKFHPDVRHEHRMRLRPGRTLHLRICDKCNKQTLSVYPQDYDGKVFCEECYKKEVYA